MADPETEMTPSRMRPSPPGAIDLPLAIYGLVTGVLAVGGSSLVVHAQRQPGALTRASSLLATVLIAVAGGVLAESILGWFLALRRGAGSCEPPSS